ncbi:similar to Saccharomyces cerevisiae YHL040C ARN1 Transporter, member of the ARN family of transporters that specifically recognize siderophore-iron chelates [Maudiozyma barnettii]|uniref:Similar to Saccharomyces cerevisiae YHL040C ARN1 Transporter, member of the ARN family of transporters that specifically recognize siderophore-iron chelates n=1 Tax=Maudiozyma barnettii TaxID=61262 RepID=A0A8H2VD38_9SACH|nr:siderophore transporter [Kazachstania barnettii]CAB4252987.1 similar to Saccharomyces cerevisiae YHL040C ARN1 Transporter, member of the ARN family of transporters that specifically recognize siderophore-iron chelates [Kazachstania barnettii]CAD1780161.1 similar to Saccharomyces cerevisiae YHL040C ARN1 Transporter, member of the ARN family of transporters that specifically recognize siderophore-iron chelates [Kazachstania barnettii]
MLLFPSLYLNFKINSFNSAVTRFIDKLYIRLIFIMSARSSMENIETHVYKNELTDKVVDNVNTNRTSAVVEIDDQDTNEPPTSKIMENKNKNLMIRKTELMSSVCDKWYQHVLLIFCAFVCGYGYGLDGNIRYIYTGYATSSYAEHSLLSTINVINAVVSAVSQIMYARLSDVFGRLSLFIVAIVLYVVGTIIQCQAYDVQRYAAGAIFYNAGYVGVLLVLLLILSDFSSLKWRLFYQFAPTWPFIINTWISGNITSAANPIKNWSWDIGMWAFIFPLTCIPIICCLLYFRWKAAKTPEWEALKHEKSMYQEFGLTSTIKQLFWQLDIIGVILMGAFLGCILVPLTLAGGTQSKWNDGRVLGPFVLGFVLIPFFSFWEIKYAKYPLVPAKLVKDRGVWAALGISFLIDFIYYMAADYLYTVLIISVNESVKSATRISSLSSFVSTVASPFFSLMLTRFTRLKPFIICGCSLWFLSMGLLYHFRGGAESHSGIIGALCVWGIGTVLFTYPVNVSCQAATNHENMATVTALNYTLYRIGSAVGAAVSGAIWTQKLYGRILKEMGDETLAKAAYSSPYTFIVTYTWGTPERQAMVEAYRYIQRLETVVALVFCVPLVAFSLCLRDAKLTDSVAHDDISEGEYVDKKSDDPIGEFFGRMFRRGKNDKHSHKSATDSSTTTDSHKTESFDEKNSLHKASIINIHI